MLGHKWEPAQGRIVDAESMPASGHGAGAAMHREHRYLIEVRMPDGELMQCQVTEKGLFAHPIGATVGVEVNSKTNEIRLNPKARASSAGGFAASPPGGFNVAEQMGLGGPGGVYNPGGTTGVSGMDAITGPGGTFDLSRLAGLLGAGGAGGNLSMHVTGPDGHQLPIAAMHADEIRNLLHTMTSGDPAAKEAARERLHQIRDQVRQQASGQQSPGQQPGAGQAFSHDDGSPQGGQFPQGGQAPSSFGSFDTTGGQGTVEERLARLRQLLDKGILTESEYAAQRQQIISQL